MISSPAKDADPARRLHNSSYRAGQKGSLSRRLVRPPNLPIFQSPVLSKRAEQNSGSKEAIESAIFSVTGPHFPVLND